METLSVRRRFPIGAELMGDGGVSFRVWAEKHTAVEVVVEHKKGNQLSVPLTREDGNYFAGVVKEVAEGDLYRFRLDGEAPLYPDPASRSQPDGPHGPSEVVNPARFQWSDDRWTGVGIEGQVIYEMHIGAFTQEGTWAAAGEQLEELARCGITVIEMMPAAEFPGRFGWGYDGVDLFAPTRLYGCPDNLRSFVDRAHRYGLAVILDVVYNHLGPDGNYLPEFSESYFTDRYTNEWGKAINFDGPNSTYVREFFITNARYWIEEFHLDGLRLDATQAICDLSREHILMSVAKAVREAAGKRRAILVAEDETQRAILAQSPADGGYGLDAIWNDDFHHSATVALTGRTEAYYTDYRGTPQEFLSIVKWGFLYQGQYSTWQGKCRGTPALGLPPAAFVLFLQNHDQIANSCCGERISHITSPALLRAITALLLLAPGTPMLFQGQEFAASTPFLYFADLPTHLAGQVHEGRTTFLSQFPSLRGPAFLSTVPAPGSPSTFRQSKLDFTERESHAKWYDLHKDLLKLRREDDVFRRQIRRGVDGAVLESAAFVLRFFNNGDDRLLLVNLGRDLDLRPSPDPLLAPPEGREWVLLWSSEDYRYGGRGIPPLAQGGPWRVLGSSTAALKAAKSETDSCRGGIDTASPPGSWSEGQPVQ